MGSCQGVSTALPVRHPHRGPHRSANQESEAEMPVEQRYGPVEHFVVTNGVWRRIPVEQKYRSAAHGSKPIPVYDARDRGDVGPRMVRNPR